MRKAIVFFIFFSILIPTLSLGASLHKVHLDWDYDDQAVEGESLVGFRLYKEGVLIAQINEQPGAGSISGCCLAVGAARSSGRFAGGRRGIASEAGAGRRRQQRGRTCFAERVPRRASVEEAGEQARGRVEMRLGPKQRRFAGRWQGKAGPQ